MVQRYEWEDGLVEAEVVGVLTPGEANMALRLARQITWNKKAPELRWANELAAECAGIGRATFYRNVKGLKAKGFIGTQGSNLIPLLPESQNETHLLYLERKARLEKSYNDAKSQNDTKKSQNETQKSQVDNPYTVDSYTDDSYSVDAAVADAPAATPSLIEVRSSDELSFNADEATSLKVEVEDLPKSHNETLIEEGKRVMFRMNPREREAFRRTAEGFMATDEQMYEAAALINSVDGTEALERWTNALEQAGAPVDRW